MSTERDSSARPHESAVYAIKIEGHLSAPWTDWFDGMTITLQKDGTSVLSGAIVDQAALHGLLRAIRDLGLPLISIVRMDPADQHLEQGEQS